MKKVYIVTDGVYSDFHNVAVFSTREKAEKFMDMFSSKDMTIEEYDLNYPDKVKGKYYQVDMLRNGDVLSCELCRYSDVNLETHIDYLWKYYHAYPEIKKSYGNSVLISDLIDKYTVRTMLRTDYYLKVVCLAKDETHAIKIANEIRAREIAENNFPDLNLFKLKNDDRIKFIKAHDCKLKDIYDFQGQLVPFDLYEEVSLLDEKMPNSIMLKPLPV